MSNAKEPEQLPRAFGPYTLLKLLARGGMGEIYLARTSGLAEFEKYYAVKKLLAKFARDPDVTTRFVDEAKLGARLGHPNIVQVYDLGRIQEELYMAAEFVDGFDLRRILRFCHEKNRRIQLDIALFIIREILSGLAYAHRQVDAQGRPIELVHRDISPQNVLVSFEGEVKIIDFGLAKSTQRSTETQANVLLGNFGYMSPEQARGKKLDVRTDVYSTGIVLFELCTGTKRFVDDNPLSLLEKVANPTPLLPSERAPGIPPEVDRLYTKATAPKREDRYQDAAEFRDDISHALYRLNPRASREHLAEFLNYLFLGGKPPKEPDKDMDGLNQSVSIRLGDLVAGSAALQSTKEGDAGNRALAEFGEKDPATQTHALMKSARMGDKVPLHELFKGEPVQARAPTGQPPPRTAPVAPPPPPPPPPQVPSAVATLPTMPAAVVPPPPLPPPAILNDSAVTPVEAEEKQPPRPSSQVTVRAPIPQAPAGRASGPDGVPFGRPVTDPASFGRAPVDAPPRASSPSLPQEALFGRPGTGASQRPAAPPPLPSGPPPGAIPSVPPVRAPVGAPPSGQPAAFGRPVSSPAQQRPVIHPAPPLPPPQEANVVEIGLEDVQVMPPVGKADLQIKRWSISAAPGRLSAAPTLGQQGQASGEMFAMGTTTAESLIIDFDEMEGAHAAVQQPAQSKPAAPPPAPRPPAPSAQNAAPGRPGASGVVVTDEGPPPVAAPAPVPVRPAMMPNANSRTGAPEPDDKARWVLKREPGSSPPTAPNSSPTSRSGNPIKK